MTVGVFKFDHHATPPVFRQPTGETQIVLSGESATVWPKSSVILGCCFAVGAIVCIAGAMSSVFYGIGVAVMVGATVGIFMAAVARPMLAVVWDRKLVIDCSPVGVSMWIRLGDGRSRPLRRWNASEIKTVAVSERTVQLKLISGLAVRVATLEPGQSTDRVRSAMLAGLARCLTCNYDLRASRERCPECGKPVPDWMFA